MSRIRSDALPLLAALVLTLPAGAFAQDAGARAGRIVSSEISISRDNAELDLELADGRQREFAIRNGQVLIDGQQVGSASRGDQLDRAWRELLNSAMDLPTGELPALLAGWDAPSGGPGARLDSALEELMQGAPAAGASLDAASAEMDARDARLDAQITRLNAQIERLEARNRELEQRVRVEARDRDRGQRSWIGRYFNNMWRQFIGILQIVMTYALFVAIGFGVVFFGRRYLEGVADTARQAPLRSWLVGVAATFLIVPAFLLGIVALAISIVGIPALIVWLPLFPVAVFLAIAFGYIAVAHAAGEALAEWRLRAGEWFRLGNSYYHVLTGMGLLLALFVLHNVASMLGLPVIPALIAVMAGFTTWAALSIGFGAVLLSRAGTRPPAGASRTVPNSEELFEEETHV